MHKYETRRYHIIYKITRDDGYYYLGMHSTDDLNDAYYGSGIRIVNSVKKHGLDRHTKEILEIWPTRKELAQREKELVTEDLLADPLCMNLTIGGPGGVEQHTAEAHARMSAKIGDVWRGRKQTPEHIAKRIAATAQKHLGRKHTAEHIAKRMQHIIGSKQNPDHVAKKAAARSRPCTVDGVTIFKSRKDLVAKLGMGIHGFRSPTFRYVVR